MMLIRFHSPVGSIIISMKVTEATQLVLLLNQGFRVPIYCGMLRGMIIVGTNLMLLSFHLYYLIKIGVESPGSLTGVYGDF